MWTACIIVVIVFLFSSSSSFGSGALQPPPHSALLARNILPRTCTHWTAAEMGAMLPLMMVLARSMLNYYCGNRPNKRNPSPGMTLVVHDLITMQLVDGGDCSACLSAATSPAMSTSCSALAAGPWIRFSMRLLTYYLTCSCCC